MVIQLDVRGVANLRQLQLEFAGATAQIEAMNGALAASAKTPTGYGNAALNLQAANRAFNNAIAASGAFRVEQLKVNDAIEHHTKLLQKQKMGFREVFGKKNKDLMHSIYREQLAMQSMLAKTSTGLVGDGTMKTTFLIPKEVPQSWDTASNRIGFFRHQLASASAEMVNWGKNTQWAGRQLMAGISMPVVAFGAAAGYMSYQVDKQFTRIQKVYDTTANVFSSSVEEQMAAQKELDQLRRAGAETAKKAARDYAASVTDTLEVQAELAATGQKGLRLQENTAQIMRISMLGEIDHQTTTKALIALQSTLGATAKETAVAFDYLNSVENATSLATADFAAAIPVALNPMKQMSAEGTDAIGVLQNLSILMVAMRERGIEAGEGANAIKAMMQRLYRPSKQIREEWMQIAKIDPKQIVENFGGDIMQILPALGEAIDDLTKPQQTQLLAGLFGTYQVTRMRAMLEGIQQINDEHSQTNSVLKLNQKSYEDWADVAERERKQYLESAAGQFKSAYEQVRAELADIGEPFLQAATTFLKVIEFLFEQFNKLPDGAKHFAAYSAIIVALIGPAIMLTGLFANMIGNIGKMTAFALKGASAFELINKNQWATKLSAKMAEQGFITEGQAIANATVEMNAMNAALTHMIEQYAVLSGMPIPAQFVTPATLRPGMIPHKDMPAHSSSHVQSGPAFVGMPGGLTAPLGAAAHGARKTELEMQAESAKKAAQAERDRLFYQSKITNEARAEETIKKKTAEHVKGAAVGTAAMAVSMGLMMFTSDAALQNVANILLLLTLAIPAGKGIATGLAAAGGWSAKIAKTQFVAAKGAFNTAKNVGKAAGKGKALWAVTKGTALGFATMVGPIGLIAGSIALIGYGLYKMHQHEVAITKEKEAQARAIYDQNTLLQDQLKIQVEQKQTISTPTGGVSIGGMTASDLASQMEADPSFKNLINTIKDGNEFEVAAASMTKYIDILNATGGNAKKAQTYLEALYMAAGKGALEAEGLAQEYANTIGSTATRADLANMFAQQMLATMGDSEKSIKEQGTAMGKTIADSIARGTNMQAGDIIDTFDTTVNQAWDAAFADLDESTAAGFEKYGVNTGKQLREIFLDVRQMRADMTTENAEELKKAFQAEHGINWSQGQTVVQMAAGWQGFADLTEGLLGSEEAIVKELAHQLRISEDITTFAQLRATWEWKLQTATAQNSKHLYKQRVEEERRSHGMLQMITGLSDEQKLRIANQILESRGLQRQNDLTAALAILWDKNRDKVDGAGKALDEVEQKIRHMPTGFINLKIDAEQALNIRKSGMEGVMNDLADAASTTFDERMDAALESAQSGWDKRMDAMDRAQEDQMDRFEARYERMRKAIEDRYDAQIKGIDKAIEAEQKADEVRQRIFEAEKTRLERLSEMANRNIDFNMAIRTGDLDEAAKIRNDMEAEVMGWALGDAADAGARGTERRIAALEDRQDILEEQRDNELEALDKREDAERKHLERLQEMRKDALQAQSEAEMSAMRDRWEMDKKTLDDRLELFQAYTGRNQADLERWMEKVGLSYDDFGLSVKDKGEEWSRFFENSLAKHVRKAGAEIASDTMWEALGNRSSNSILRGMGFKNKKAFRNFLMTGNLPDDFGQVRRGKNNPPPEGNTQTRHPNTGMGPQDNHGGGWIGKGGSGRKGVARTIKGLGPGERYVRARDEEFMVNEDAARRYGGLLEDINSGRGPKLGRGNRGYGVGGYGLVGMVSAAMGVGLAKGVGQTFQNAYRAGRARSIFQGDTGGVIYNKFGVLAGAGKAYPSVRGKGWSNSHDYRNGVGSPIYAFADGRIVDSRDITSGGSPGNGVFTAPNGLPYRSYGAMVVVEDKAGNRVLAAHLQPGTRAAVGPVKAGQLIGLSGWTGNATGPHTHFEFNGSEMAREMFVKYGIGLRRGGVVKRDGLANIHKDEAVISPDKTNKLYDAIDKMAGNTANLTNPAIWTWLSGQLGTPIAKAVQDATTSVTGSGDTVKTGTYNISWRSSPSTTGPALQKLMGLADVLSLQEVYGDRVELVRRVLADNGWGMSQYKNDSIVAYNKSKYNMLNSGNRGMNPGRHGGGVHRNRNAAWALLSGAAGKFYQLSAHTNPMFGQMTAGGSNYAIQRAQYGTLTDMVNAFAKNAPVILGGDLNWELNRPGGIPIANLVSVLAGKNGLNGLHTHQGGGDVDHLMYGPGSSLVSSRIIGGLPSDHNALLSEIKIPSLRTGGDIRWDNTLANLHKRERVLTAENTALLDKGLENFASGGNAQYNVNVYVTQPDATAEEIADKVEKRMKRRESRKPTKRTNR